MLKVEAYRELYSYGLSGLASIVAVLFFGFTLLFSIPASAGVNHPYHIRTDYATIHYSDPAAIENFAALLDKGNVRPRFAGSTGSTVDRIVFRVRNLLGIHTPGFHINIYLLESRQVLEKIYAEMGLGDKAPVAFYSRSTGSVFISLDAVNDGILAHEVAHAVINSHYNPPLPSRMQEILARFVDKNLWVE